MVPTVHQWLFDFGLFSFIHDYFYFLQETNGHYNVHKQPGLVELKQMIISIGQTLFLNKFLKSK